MAIHNSQKIPILSRCQLDSRWPSAAHSHSQNDSAKFFRWFGCLKIKSIEEKLSFVEVLHSLLVNLLAAWIFTWLTPQYYIMLRDWRVYESSHRIRSLPRALCNPVHPEMYNWRHAWVWSVFGMYNTGRDGHLVIGPTRPSNARLT